MCSLTTAVAADCRLQTWTAQVRECQARQEGMSVVAWCEAHGLSKSAYYYRLQKLREACLENLPLSTEQSVVPVPAACLKKESETEGLELFVGGIRVQVSPATSMSLLASVVQVLRDAQ